MSSSKHSHECIVNSIIFGNNVTFECSSSTNSTLFLPSTNGREGQFLAIINGRMKWVDPPNPDLIRLSQTVEIKADQSSYLLNIPYQAKHDDPHPICTIQGEGDLERIITYYLTDLTVDNISILISTNANLINTKFNKVDGIYRNLKALNSSNGMLMVIYIDQYNKVILNKCMTEDGDGYFVHNETDITFPINVRSTSMMQSIINVLDIYPLHEKKLGLVHNDKDNNIIFISCSLPDGNGIKTNTIIDNCPVNIIKLVSTRTEVVVISYIATDGYLYYGYSMGNYDTNGWVIKMLPTNIKVIGGYLDMITFNGQSIAILYYTDNKELMLVYTTDTIDNGSWEFKLIDTILDGYQTIQLLHLENNEFIILYGNKVYYNNKVVIFDQIRSAASIILNEGNQLTILGLDNNGAVYSISYDLGDSLDSKVEGKILYQGVIINGQKVIESQLLYTSTGTLINAYLTDQTPGIIISPFKDRFAYDTTVNINCLIK